MCVLFCIYLLVTVGKFVPQLFFLWEKQDIIRITHLVKTISDIYTPFKRAALTGRDPTLNKKIKNKKKRRSINDNLWGILSHFQTTENEI